jgi:hypothetical protein
MEGFNKKELPFIAIFIDFTKAFDSINREIMWKILLSYGIPDKIVCAIKTAYDLENKNSRKRSSLGKYIEIDTGILQGDAHLLFLFIIVFDYVMKKLPKKYGVLTHENPDIKLNDIEYADDGVVFSEDQHAAIKHTEAPPFGEAKALRASSLHMMILLW